MTLKMYFSTEKSEGYISEATRLNKPRVKKYMS